MTVTLRRAWAADLDAATLYWLLALRAEVFVVEQSCHYQDLDGRDLEPATRHFWLENAGGEVISCLRLMQDDPADDTSFHIGRVCTKASERGRGHTARLMRAALAEVGPRPCRLGAQSHLADMYARYGFVVDGPEYLEDDIPHLPMLREPQVSMPREDSR